MHGARILLVEDDVPTARAWMQLLIDQGYNLTLAHDFDSALSLMEGGQTFHLLITDVVLPGGPHGFALARMGRARRRSLKIVYVTGHQDQAAPHLPAALGPVLYKPVSNNDLLATIEAALATR